MKEINLADFFEVVQDENYCIVKRGDIEKYKSGADFDIFCFDIQSFSKKIIAISQDYIKNDYELKINDSRETHWHIDLLQDKKIVIRFDLYAAMPSYKNINVKDGLFSSIVENRVEEEIVLDEENIKVYYPSLVDEIIIKYLEYIENYQLRPEKVKHLDYILEKLEEDSDNKKFLDKLHFYTSFSKNIETRKISIYEKFIGYLQYLFINIKILLNNLENNGVKDTILKIKKRLSK